MPQGKLKVKTKLPNAKKPQNAKSKQNQVSRKNRPTQPKKKKIEDAHKLKTIITKTVNKAAEEEIRKLTSFGKKELSSAQKAVADFHTKKK